MSFPNQSFFDDPQSVQRAQGIDLRASTAITDAQGRVLFRAQTGGMISPQRREIAAGTKLFRFGKQAAGIAGVAAGSWWIERQALDQIIRFGEVWGLSVGMALRTLCLVPPEWSDTSLLIRVATTRNLLAWSGLANSVVIPAGDGGPDVRMPHQNDLAARRVTQLFIPGMTKAGSVQNWLRLEQSYPLDKQASRQGFLYL
ncbi:hypothetical protein SAMN05421538_102149 [Paracoccus isoporae]|uniref:Uncharacterized protein n=1 Tax=Paracoccus isoporae TaxID=591205 RepID=A0A1G6WJ59_9RHOB|nr:hypothetical protein [Paracoccus isoporae]SDD65814.1 hypothetical protein SAMN05421538_102149 [Paracoccus isoporae]